MNIAILLRYTNRGDGGHWDHIYHMQHDYELMARKYGVGLVAIITEFDAERDVVFAKGHVNEIKLSDGEFIITYPDDAHLPNMKKLNDSISTRAIAKIRV